MKRLLLGLSLLSLAALPALAQETTPTPMTTTVQVGHSGWTVSLPSDEPLVVWAGETFATPAGQFAKVSVFVQTSEGQWVQMTGCDNIAITCETVLMRMDGISQGDMVFLAEAP